MSDANYIDASLRASFNNQIERSKVTNIRTRCIVLTMFIAANGMLLLVGISAHMVSTNGNAGNPSLLYKVATGQSAYKYRTPVGAPTLCIGHPAASVGGETTTESPEMAAVTLWCHFP